jgi:mono/diheme cytochrome c family protein
MVMARSTRFAAFVLILGVALAGCEARRSPSGFRLPEGNADAGKQAFVSLQCATCHTVKGVDGLPASEMKPPVELGSRVMPQSDGEVTADIIVPSAHFARGYPASQVQEGARSKMPDYSERITVRQLADLVAFLQNR